MQRHQKAVGCSRLRKSAETNIAGDRTRPKCRLSPMRDLRPCSSIYCLIIILPCPLFNYRTQMASKCGSNRKKDSIPILVQHWALGLFSSRQELTFILVLVTVFYLTFSEGSTFLIRKIFRNILKRLGHIGLKKRTWCFSMTSAMCLYSDRQWPITKLELSLTQEKWIVKLFLCTCCYLYYCRWCVAH